MINSHRKNNNLPREVPYPQPKVMKLTMMQDMNKRNAYPGGIVIFSHF